MVLRLTIPDIYANIRIAVDRIPIFIFGIYSGMKSVDEEHMKAANIIGIYITTIILELFIRIDALSSISSFCFYYTCSFFGISALMLLCQFLSYLEKSKIRAVSIANHILESLGMVTLETYLLHSAFKNMAHYPAEIIMYILIAVILPILVAFAIHYVGQWFDNMIKWKGKL